MHNLTKNVIFLVRTIDGAVREDGTINAKRAAEEIGLLPTTLFRILRDESGQARPKTEQKILSYFGINKEQLYADNIELAMSDDNVKRTLAEIDTWPLVDRIRIIEALGVPLELTPKKPS